MRHDPRPTDGVGRVDVRRAKPASRPGDDRLDQWGNALLARDEHEVDRIVRETRAAITRDHVSHDGSLLG